MQKLVEVLEDLREIGKQIAALTEKSKTLRLSLMESYPDLPKAYSDQRVAQVVVGDRIHRIIPVKKDDDNQNSKIIDVTVTSEPVVVVNKLEINSSC